MSDESQGRKPWFLLTRAGRKPTFLMTDHDISVVNHGLALSDMDNVLGEDIATQHAKREERENFCKSHVVVKT